MAIKRLNFREVINLTDKSGSLNLFALAVPMFFQQLCTMMLGTVSTVILARVSENAVTAVNVANMIINIPLNLIAMITNGMLIILGIYLGAGRTENIGDAYVTGMIANAVLSIFLSVVSYAAANPILSIMNINGEILKEAVLYFRIRMIFIVFTALTNCICAVLRAYGIVRPTLISGLLANGINVLVSLAAINSSFVADKVAGIAFAAVIGQLIGLIYAFAELYGCKNVPCKGRFTPPILQLVLKVGIPAGMSLLTYVITAAFSTAVIASLGQAAVNVKVFTSNISGFTYLFGYAVAQAGALMISRCVGSGRNGLADRLFKLNARFVPLLNAALAFIVFVMSGPLMSFFTDNADYISEARIIFLIDIIIETARGNTHVGENALCSTADTLFAAIVTITSCIVFGAFGSWLLCIKFGLGLYGYFVASAIDETVRGILFRIRWKSGRWSVAAKNIG